MKKVLTILLFLGVTTSGFSQIKTRTGKATLHPSAPNVIDISCRGTGEICYFIHKEFMEDKWKITIPSLQVSWEIQKPYINGVPLEDLPDDLDNIGPDENHYIEFEK